MPKVLVVDDEQSICWGIERLGDSMGHHVFVASSAEQGLRLAAECQPDLLILDVRLPGKDGLTAIPEFRRILGRVPIVVMTAFGDLATAVKAVQHGAFEYILKPFDLTEIRSTIRRALLSTHSLHPDAQAQVMGGMLGRTPVMQEVFKRIALAAAADVAVLVQGESGVGKAMAAEAIHRHSSRAGGPFITASVSGYDGVQAELELFGHAAGINPIVPQERRGMLLDATGGTLLLEDVADLPPGIQVKLIRAFEAGEITPVGGPVAVPLDVRVIATTTYPLVEKVQKGALREDLFHWLTAFEIVLPPLRERRADIPLLARHFAAQRRGTSVNFAEESLAELINRPWYGNVQELRAAIDHALVVARAGLILPDHLPRALPELKHSSARSDSAESLSELAKRRATDLLDDPQSEGLVYEKFLEEVEPALLASAMERFSQECAPAARALGLHRTTLKRKLDQYKIAK